MMKYFFTLLLLVGFSFSSKATSYISIPANSASYDLSADDCMFNSDGTVTSGGTSCTLYFPVPINAGETISSIKVYYYDNSGSQSVSVKLIKTTLASNSSSTVSSFTDTSTSSSIQYQSLSSTTISSSYSYMMVITLNYGSELRGIKISI